MHPDWAALRAAVVADPDDDTTRLAAADFLQENGDPDRAAFIRVQVELARVEAAGEGKGLAADELRAKERAFLGPLAMHRVWWAMAECPELVRMDYAAGRLEVAAGGVDRLAWRRGFVDGVRCPAGVWLRHGRAVRQRNPVTGVTLSGCDRVTRDQWYAGLAALTGLRRVDLADPGERVGEWLAGWLPGTEVRTAVR
ncbi:MAG: hypothetical protein C0501_25585 [Isosphaera sp.]|nr:hypothetical protein [Isosphaera sp.]